MSKSNLLRYLPIGGVIVIVLFALFYKYSVKVTVTDISSWYISENSSASLLWQKQDRCLTYSFAPNGSLAIVGNQVIFYEGCFLQASGLRALDLLTGNFNWWRGAPNSYQVLAVEDGVVNVEGDTTLVKYDLEGNKVWQSNDFPPHGPRRALFNNGLLYVPLYKATDILSNSTGETIDHVDGETFFADFNEVNIRYKDDKLYINSKITEEITVIDHISDINSLYTNVFKNVLVIYFGNSRLNAYDINSGKLLWGINQEMSSKPIIVDGLLYLYQTTKGLLVYDVSSGRQLTSIYLKRNGKYNDSVQLAGAGNIIVLNFYEAHEIVAIQVSAENLVR